ncbi:DUF6789 family protein [Natronobiforma cellulositropha]|uniref:DUF6789 family protein n=1 Tax=Natronobiforma cellulositropha TaxID=1679076 RepID=UPI0021D5AB89|nr:DUF6789 family protein [Natronobiforma cellulositropha]
MASETVTRSDAPTETGLEPWQAGAVGGIAGAVVFGAMMAAMVPDMLAAMIPAMYGLEGTVAGWGVHLFHGAVLGLVFGVALTAAGRQRTDLATGVGAGVAYGVLLWAILAVVVMPVWLGMAEMVPNLDTTSLVGHVVYGATLGVVYATLE